MGDWQLGGPQAAVADWSRLDVDSTTESLL